MTGYAGLPVVTLEDAAKVFEPPGTGEGYWVGAPCVHQYEDATYLAVRWRSPDRRGYEIVIYERKGLGEFKERVSVTAEELGAVSVERPALVTDPRTGDLVLYVPVDHGENEWTIQRLDGVATPSALDPDTARDILVPRPGTTDEETVKDPYIVTLAGRYYMFYAGHDGVSEQAHLATSVDGENWTRVGTNPILGRDGWHDHHTRISCVFPAPNAPVWILYYDGSGTGDYGATWNLRTGAAVATDLASPVDTTTDAPALTSPDTTNRTELESFGTCRYVDLLITNGRPELFAEVARPDGAFELRRSFVEQR